MSRRAMAALAGIFALALSACGSTGNASDTGASSDAKLKIGYIADNEKIAFPHLVTLGIQAAAKDAGIDLVVCDPQGDAAKALQCAITMKQQGVKGLINYQDNEKVAPQICAQGPQVPVIAISIKQEPCQTSYTGANNVEAGTIAGDAVGKYVKDKFDCKYDAYISLEAPKAGQLNSDRMGSYQKAFAAVCGEIHDLHVIDTRGVADVARAAVTDTLTALPDAHKIVIAGLNDSVILASLAAASAANRAQDVFVSGQGLDPSGVCGMKKNADQWIGDTGYFPENYGKVIVPAIIKAAQGEQIPALLPAKLAFVTPQTLDQYYPSPTC